MITRVIQILHKIQYKIPAFFTIALWILMFTAFIIGNHLFAYCLLSFLIIKIIIQLSFWATLIKKMNRLMEADGDQQATDNMREEIKAFICHTKIVIDEADFRRQLTDRHHVEEEDAQLINHQRQILGDLGQQNNKIITDEEYVYLTVDDFDCYNNLKIGDYVKVNNDVCDPDFPEVCLTNYRGRILDFLPDEEDITPFILIEWDSFSLNQMSKKYLKHCIEKGLDYTQMQLSLDDVTRTSPRDTVKDIERAKRDLWYKIEDQ